MPSYKLTYFPARCRAEVARQLFHLADVPFEDNRISISQWPALKAKTPFGQLPMLEVDGEVLAQSHVIFRYLAKEFDKDQLVREVAVPARDKHFPILEKLAKENGSNGHFVGASLTWVDLLIADHVSVLTEHLPGFLDKYPIVLETVRRIEATPKLKEWIKKRPESSI